MIEIETPADVSARRRKRAVVVATVAALIAGTAGYLLGRSTDEPKPGGGAVPSTVVTSDSRANGASEAPVP
jgi:hypothetical protein